MPSRRSTEAATGLGGIDALVYAPAIGPLARLVDTDADTWRRVFDTNVTGAAIVTAAAIPYLTESAGVAVYLSSVSASLTPPWPGLGAYIVSKAALDKLVEAWRVEHPGVGFTRLVVGDCAGGEGDAQTGFTTGWDPDLAVELGTIWVERATSAVRSSRSSTSSTSSTRCCAAARPVDAVRHRRTPTPRPLRSTRP